MTEPAEPDNTTGAADTGSAGSDGDAGVWWLFVTARLDADERLATAAEAELARQLGEQGWLAEWVWGRGVFGGALVNRQGQRLALRTAPDTDFINARSPDRVHRQVAALRVLAASYRDDAVTLMAIADMWVDHPDHPLVDTSSEP